MPPRFVKCDVRKQAPHISHFTFEMPAEAPAQFLTPFTGRYLFSIMRRISGRKIGLIIDFVSHYSEEKILLHVLIKGKTNITGI